LALLYLYSVQLRFLLNRTQETHRHLLYLSAFSYLPAILLSGLFSSWNDATSQKIWASLFFFFAAFFILSSFSHFQFPSTHIPLHGLLCKSPPTFFLM